MFVSDILNLSRLRLDDVVKDAKGNYLWPDSELLIYHNESVRELAKKSRCLYDSSTSAICTYAVYPGIPTLSIDRRIVEINAAYLTNSQRPLFRKPVKYFDSHIALWGWQSTGWRSVQEMPIYYIPNYEPNKLRFYPYYPVTYQSKSYQVAGKGSTNDILFDPTAFTITKASGGLSIFNIDQMKILIAGSGVTPNIDGIYTIDGVGSDTVISVNEVFPCGADQTKATITKVIDTLNLEVARLPLTDVAIANIATAIPEVDEDYHIHICDGIMAQAYLKRDSETYNIVESKKFQDRWDSFVEDVKNDQIIIGEDDTVFEPSFGAI
jgi:hypothetical protein